MEVDTRRPPRYIYIIIFLIGFAAPFYLLLEIFSLTIEKKIEKNNDENKKKTIYIRARKGYLLYF